MTLGLQMAMVLYVSLYLYREGMERGWRAGGGAGNIYSLSYKNVNASFPLAPSALQNADSPPALACFPPQSAVIFSLLLLDPFVTPFFFLVPRARTIISAF